MLELCDKDIKPVKDCRKEAYVSRFKICCRCICLEEILPLFRPFPFLLFLMLAGAKQHRPGIFVTLQRKFWVIQHLISTRHSWRLAKLLESVGFMGSFSSSHTIVAWLTFPFWEAIGAYGPGLFALYNGLLCARGLAWLGGESGAEGERQGWRECCSGSTLPQVSVVVYAEECFCYRGYFQWQILGFKVLNWWQ